MTEVVATASQTAANLPLWALFAIGFGTPIIGLSGVLVGQLLVHTDAQEDDRRGRREELMRTVRWAAEKAVDADARTAELGVASLRALGTSPLLQSEDQDFIDAVTSAVVAPAIAAVEGVAWWNRLRRGQR
jgi:IMP dehydrogenase/GMP reductase